MTEYLLFFQYFDGRLFCVGNGALSAIDLTEETIQKAMVTYIVTI